MCVFVWMWQKRKSNSMANDSNKQRYYLMTDNWWIVDFPLKEIRPTTVIRSDVSVRACFATLNIYKLFLFIVRIMCETVFFVHTTETITFCGCAFDKHTHPFLYRLHGKSTSECCFYVWNRFHRNAKGLWFHRCVWASDIDCPRNSERTLISCSDVYCIWQAIETKDV